MSEQTNTPKGIDFIPPEASVLLDPAPQENVHALPTDPTERDHIVLASNVSLVARFMNRHGKVIGDGVSRVLPMYTPNEQHKVIRITDSAGESEIRLHPLLKDTPKKLLSATIKKPGMDKREEVSLEDIPPSHWVTLAGANEFVRKEKPANDRRRGWFMRRLLGS